MDRRIRNLTSTTCGGERLSRRALAAMQEAVQFFPQLSRTELARTACEQRGWHTPGESTRWRISRGVLGELERLGIVQLPASQGRGRGPQNPLQCDRRSAPQLSAREPLAELAPVRQETYVNPRQHPAANWQLVGRTQARDSQRERPGRSYPRRFCRPSKKWRHRKPADPQTPD